MRKLRQEHPSISMDRSQVLAVWVQDSDFTTGAPSSLIWKMDQNVHHHNPSQILFIPKTKVDNECVLLCGEHCLQPKMFKKLLSKDRPLPLETPPFSASIFPQPLSSSGSLYSVFLTCFNVFLTTIKKKKKKKLCEGRFLCILFTALFPSPKTGQVIKKHL